MGLISDTEHRLGAAIRCAYGYAGSVEPIIRVSDSNVNDHNCPVERGERAQWLKLRRKR